MPKDLALDSNKSKSPKITGIKSKFFYRPKALIHISGPMPAGSPGEIASLIMTQVLRLRKTLI